MSVLKDFRRRFPRSFRVQMLISVSGVSIILAISTAYILSAAKNLQNISNSSFEQERFIKTIQEDLAAYQEPLLEYLSTRSSNALARILIESQALRNKLPAYSPITADKTELKERELYFLIYAYLNLADQAIEEKRGRNIAAYTRIYDEMAGLLAYINEEIEMVNTERFSNQLDAYELFIAKSGTIQFWNLFFIIFVSILSILLLFQSAGRLTDPLVRLSALAADLSSGNFEIPDIQTGSVAEMDQVVEAFNRMKNDIRQFIEEIRWQENIKQEYMREKLRNMKMEGLVRHMEIYALQAQMNPHFLFNTLNTGMQLAIVEGADRTGEFMEYLARLFRHIIRNKELTVPLRHEIEGLNYYFAILKVRFPKNLDLILDYDESLLDGCKVPVSILQPLVENCVIHAFKDSSAQPSAQPPAQPPVPPPVAPPAARRSLIMVRAEKSGNTLILSVRDNGCGMPAETAEKLLHPLSIDESSMERVMGLENVIQRLYFFYPDDPGVVSIETGEGRGTAIIIRIDTEREPCLAF
ncbi:MAG: histidine kinase [Spirochaetaceae bacterium]|jgi:sensor histidine kinase YesM|nr:histidine kinase [Spirochaetaceae bacterium]